MEVLSHGLGEKVDVACLHQVVDFYSSLSHPFPISKIYRFSWSAGCDVLIIRSVLKPRAAIFASNCW